MYKYLLFLFFPFGAIAQNSAAYSDEDLKHYIAVSDAMFSHRLELAAKAKSLQEELQISPQEMEGTLQALKEAGSWEALKPELDPQFAKAFEQLMNFRAGLKQSMRQQLIKLISAYAWDEDYYQHMQLTVQSDPALQERLLTIKKSQG